MTEEASVDNHYKEKGSSRLLFFFESIWGIITNMNNIHVLFGGSLRAVSAEY